MQSFDILIVGGGHGGAQAAIALRQAKFEGSIAIVGDEAEYPYERPPLSKDYFAGEKPFERIMIRPPAFWTERNVEMLLGKRVDAVDATAHSVTTSDGDVIGYGQMIWATGGSPRWLHSGQQQISRNCSGAKQGEERFSEGDWQDDEGTPWLADGQASFVCRVVNRADHGTHSVFIGEVRAAHAAKVVDPLVYVDGRYLEPTHRAD